MYVIYTALLDAIGITINKAGKTLADTKEERPDKVMFVIITDGMENSSSELTYGKIKEIIEHRSLTVTSAYVIVILFILLYNLYSFKDKQEAILLKMFPTLMSGT